MTEDREKQLDAARLKRAEDRAVDVGGINTALRRLGVR